MERGKRELSPGEEGDIYSFDSSPDISASYENSRPSSSAYVMWDFDLPPASERVKKEAEELRRELLEPPYPPKRRNRRSSPKKKPAEDTPSKTQSYCRSVKLLKEAIGGVPSVLKYLIPLIPEDPSEKEKLPDKTSTSKSNLRNSNDSENSSFQSEKSDTQPSAIDIHQGNESPDLFDDSFNEFMNEYSKTVENNFYKPKTPEKENRHTLNDRNGSLKESQGGPSRDNLPQTPPSGYKAEFPRERNYTPRNLCHELDEVDDDLFLEVDM